MKYRELVQILALHGFTLMRESKHHIYGNSSGITIAIPHCREVAIGTLRDIFKLLYPESLGEANKAMRKALGRAS